VTVRGTVSPALDASKDVTVIVNLKTAKGEFSNAGGVSNHQFDIAAKFDTQKSPYSPIGGTPLHESTQIRNRQIECIQPDAR